jgi:hypothetical protein
VALRLEEAGVVVEGAVGVAVPPDAAGAVGVGLARLAGLLGLAGVVAPPDEAGVVVEGLADPPVSGDVVGWTATVLVGRWE